MDYEYLHELGLLTHRPLIEPDATSRRAEHVFSKRWEQLMTTDSFAEPPLGYDETDIPLPNLYLVRILRDLDIQITQRHATVCASFIKWLGTNFGRCLIDQTRQAIWLGSSEEQYLFYWTKANMRRCGINHGYRVLEHMLSPQDNYSLFQIKLSADDYETADKLVMWLSTPDGMSFYDNALKEINEVPIDHPIL